MIILSLHLNQYIRVSTFLFFFNPSDLSGGLDIKCCVLCAVSAAFGGLGAAVS